VKKPHHAPPAEIDWDALRARLVQAASVTRQVGAPSAEQAAILLAERARRLARPSVAMRPAALMLDLLLFELSGERYGIETCYVQEVWRFAGLTPVPSTPDVVAGLANLRGEVLVVFDIRPLLGLRIREATEASRIVVCGQGKADLGLMVDAAHEIVGLPAGSLQRETGPDKDAESFIRGIARDATIVIDGAALLSDQRLLVGQPRRQ
jgi:purine-binding chemotaxis protein CheW